MYQTTAKRLLSVYRAVKTNPDISIKTNIWNDPKWTAEQFMVWFRACLHQKINRHDPRNGWKKCSDDYQKHLIRDSRLIKEYYGSRIRHTGSMNILHLQEFKIKYPFINTQINEV